MTPFAALSDTQLEQSLQGLGANQGWDLLVQRQVRRRWRAAFVNVSPPRVVVMSAESPVRRETMLELLTLAREVVPG